MIRLNLNREPVWLEVAPGVSLRLAPATSAVLSSAREDPLLADVRAREEDEDPIAEIEGKDRGEIAVLFAKAVGKRTILEWEGVEGEDGKPAPVTPEGIEALLDIYPVFEAFQTRFMARWLGLESEKNVSAPSPNGTSAGATATARPARDGAKRARPPKAGRKP